MARRPALLGEEDGHVEVELVPASEADRSVFGRLQGDALGWS